MGEPTTIDEDVWGPFELALSRAHPDIRSTVSSLFDADRDLGIIVPIRPLARDLTTRRVRHGEFTTRHDLDRLNLVTTTYDRIVEAAFLELLVTAHRLEGPGSTASEPDPACVEAVGRCRRETGDTVRHLGVEAPPLSWPGLFERAVVIHRYRVRTFVMWPPALAEAQIELARAVRYADELGELHVLNGADGDLVPPPPEESEAGTPLRLLTTRPILRTGPPAERPPTGPLSGGAIAA